MARRRRVERHARTCIGGSAISGGDGAGGLVCDENAERNEVMKAVAVEDAQTRRKKQREERDQFRTECEAEYCPNWVSQATRDAVWRKAWEDGHSSGNAEVAFQYDDLMDIVRTMQSTPAQGE